MKRVLAFLTALTLLIALCPAALAQAGFSPRLAVVSGTDPTSVDRLTLRLTPYDASPSVARLYVGTYVRVVGYSGVWAEVEVGGGDTTMLHGYVPRRCLDETLQTVCQMTPTLKVNNKTGGEGIILRAEASKISRALGLFPNGSSMTVLAMMPEGWYFVQAGGLTGYAAEYGFDNALGTYDDAPAVGTLANDWESNRFDAFSAYCAVKETSAGYFDFTCTVDFKPSVLSDTIVGIYVYANRELVCMLPVVDSTWEQDTGTAAQMFTLTSVHIADNPTYFEFYPLWGTGLSGTAAGRLFRGEAERAAAGLPHENDYRAN